jgi:RNA-directed DNA polymerase
MKRSPIGLDAVADWHNLAAAFHRAAVGKRARPEVQRFGDNLDHELARLRREILAGTPAVWRMRRFRIRDPKPRIIHAPFFRERVLHHALMAHVGPVLDRALVEDTYACRVGKGALAAVERARHHLQRFPWYAKIDIRSYFASIDHALLGGMLARRFKDKDLLALMRRIVDAHHTEPGKGLPIGALTSQQFANSYLAGLDRLLLEGCKVRGLVRYMDDLVWWGDSHEAVRQALDAALAYAHDRLALEIKRPVQIGRSRHGLSFCGYRILPERLLLSRRRKRRYAECRRDWQAGYASALAITAHTDAVAWRREQLRRRPFAEPLAAL